MKKIFQRRDVLKSAGLGGVAIASPFLGHANSRPKLSDTIQEAEKILDVSYTDQERDLLEDTVEGYLDRIKRRRMAFSPENNQPPALTFNPLLKNEHYKEMGNKVILSSQDGGPLPDNEEDIAFAPTWRQAVWLRKTALTSRRLTQVYLNRIEKYARKLECFATVTRDLALKQADRADQELAASKDRGSLHGIPYGVKDLIDTAGIETSWGAIPYQGRIPDENATIIERLNEAGAVMLGKTTLGALAYGDMWHGGITRNPWAREEGSSGSSAGSASATASALVSFSIGTETLGSIISPSNRCGVTGLRPTFGRIPRTGAMALCWSLDKIGPICRYSEDTALVLQALNGDDGKDSSAFDWGFEYGTEGTNDHITIGYDPAWFVKTSKCEKETLSHLRDAGVTLKEISLPDLPYELLLSILEVEAAAAFEELTLSNRDDQLTWQEEVAWPNTFRAARFHSSVEVIQVDRFRRHVMEVMNELYKNVDMLISPANVTDLLYSTNYTGHPCLTLPVGFAERVLIPLTGQSEKQSQIRKSLPRNIVLWGNMLREDQLITIGNLLEKKVKFHRNRPSML